MNPMFPRDDQHPKVPQTHTGSNPPETLLVFDRLEVGPVRLENRRLNAPYRFVDNGRDDRVDLTYSMETGGVPDFPLFHYSIIPMGSELQGPWPLTVLTGAVLIRPLKR
jgi:hypothetical protein